jgi:hypothetical protein
MEIHRSLASLIVFFALPLWVNANEVDARNWRFRVYLDDKEIGSHTFSVQKSAAQIEVTSSARFDVKVLFINAYQYRHEAKEIWRDDCLTDLSALTEDNGTQLSVKAVQSTVGLNVSTEKKKFNLSGCVMSFAYWNPLMLQQTRLLNSQTGEYEQVIIKPMSATTLQISGKAQVAQQYRLTGKKLQIDLWYAPDGTWLALESMTERGARLRYVLSG